MMKHETTTDAIRVLERLKKFAKFESECDEYTDEYREMCRQDVPALDSAIGAMKMLGAATDTLTRIAAMTDPDDLTNHRNYEPDECLQEVFEMATKSVTTIQEVKQQ